MVVEEGSVGMVVMLVDRVQFLLDHADEASTDDLILGGRYRLYASRSIGFLGPHATQ